MIDKTLESAEITAEIVIVCFLHGQLSLGLIAKFQKPYFSPGDIIFPGEIN